jgi:hypothetical protein
MPERKPLVDHVLKHGNMAKLWQMLSRSEASLGPTDQRSVRNILGHFVRHARTRSPIPVFVLGVEADWDRIA